MELVNPYCSVSDVQSELHNTEGAVAEWLQSCVNAASRYIDEWRGRDYFQHDYTSTPLVVRGAVEPYVDGDKLTLPISPVISITSVFDGLTALTAEVDYVLVNAWHDMQRSILVRVGSDWSTGKLASESVRIYGKFGYAQSAAHEVPAGLPPNVHKAAVLLAAAFSTMEQKDIISADGMRDRVATKTIPPQVQVLLGARAGRLLA